MMTEQKQAERPATYQITVLEQLDESWSVWFDKMAIAVSRSKGGRTITTLTGPITDQARLHGLLARLREMGLVILSLQRLQE